MRFLNKCFFVIVVFLFLCCDEECLNSFYTVDENVSISDVSYLEVDYDDIISHDSDVSSDLVAVKSNSLGTLLVSSNRVASLDSWAWPTDTPYTITTYFGSGHQALDIYSYSGYGSSVYAANNGVVSLVMGGCVSGNLSCNGSGGNYVVINHNNGYYTVYMHLASIYVGVGDVVSRGQVIGAMGNTGNVIPVPYNENPYLGTHLHFCLYQGVPYHGGVAINPLTLY